MRTILSKEQMLAIAFGASYSTYHYTDLLSMPDPEQPHFDTRNLPGPRRVNKAQRTKNRVKNKAARQARRR